MIAVKNPNQQELFDPWSHISPKRKIFLEKSWVGLFKNEILSEFPVAESAPHFCNNNERPIKELYTIVEILLWKVQKIMDILLEMFI